MAKSRRSYGGLILLLVLIATAAGGAYYWTHKADVGPEYYTTAASKGEVVQSVTATGTIKPLRDILVSSQVSGYINKIFVDFNDKVKAHQVIATLDPTAYQAQVQSAEADLENSKAALALQQVDVDRDKQLKDKGIIAQADFDTATALLAEAQAQVKLKEAAVLMATTNLSFTTIYAPVDGIVIARNVDVGNTVAASLSAPTLYEIGTDLAQMQIDAAVAEADIGNVLIDQTVNFTVDAYPNQEFRGTVYQVRNAPSTQQNVVIYDVMIHVPNEDLKLKPGMTANVSIIISRHPDVLKIANSALRYRMPDGVNFTPAPEPPKPAEAIVVAGPKQALSPEDRRKAVRQLLQDAGWNPQSGPPSTDVVAHIVQLARDRDVELPDRVRALLHLTGRTDAPVVRTVYRLPGGNPLATPEAIRVKIGITDGTNSEVIDGLKEGDVLITGSNLPSAQPQSGSPFPGGPHR